jgi:DNA-binding protein HU-beta
MNKTQLIDLIASKCDVSKRQAADVLNCIIEGVTDSVVAGKEVSLPGLGKFFAKATAARKGRNPSTGEEIKIAA